MSEDEVARALNMALNQWRAYADETRGPGHEWPYIDEPTDPENVGDEEAALFRECRAALSGVPEGAASHEHRPTVHLCNPPAGSPYLIVCGDCQRVLWGEVTDEQAATPDVHPTLTPETLAAVPARPGERRFRDLLARERHDVGMLARHVAEMYDEVSGGRVSKPNTKPFEVIALVNERLDERYNEGHADGLEAAALRSVPSPEPLDVERLTDALNAVLHKQPSLAYAGFVYGETGAAIAREYARLAAPQPVPEDER